MAPYHAVDVHGVPKQSRRTSGSTKTAAAQVLGVRKEASLNMSGAAVKPAAAPPRREWQAGSGPEAISKQGAAAPAPTIRVIHIFAPKVIKTDLANFRSTVQRLTGRSTKLNRVRRARSKTTNCELGGALNQNMPGVCSIPSPAASFPALWDQERRFQEEVLHGFVGDVCGTNNMPPLIRSNSEESSTYSMDSGHFSSDSNDAASTDGTLPSPASTAADTSFSFYVPHRESAYSLSEIPAPFLPADMMNLCSASLSSPTSPFFASQALGLQLPTLAMESVLNFDVDNLGSGLGSPLPLPDSVGCDVPAFPGISGGSSGGGNLYDMVSSVQQHCRLSVQQPSFQSSGNFFEMT